MVYFTLTLVTHIIAVMIAVGTVTVTDYLHILGLRDPILERRTLVVFPHLSNLIRISLAIIYVTGAIMVILNPTILTSLLFWTKLLLVLIVTVNGFVLHHKVFPQIEHGIKNNHYPPTLLKIAAFGGSLSVVSWYGIVILAMTKEIGYEPLMFFLLYIIGVAVAYMVAIHIEQKQRKKVHRKKRT
jgi:hypothetical protein